MPGEMKTTIRASFGIRVITRFFVTTDTGCRVATGIASAAALTTGATPFVPVPSIVRNSIKPAGSGENSVSILSTDLMAHDFWGQSEPTCSAVTPGSSTILVMCFLIMSISGRSIPKWVR